MEIHHNENGTYPSHVWPGGYPIVYICADGGTLCPACANRKNGSEASIDLDAPEAWRLVGSDIHWEGPPEICDHCGTEIESAYGNPEVEK